MSIARSLSFLQNLDGITTVTTTTNSTGTTTGALRIIGGLGIGGNINLGGSLSGGIKNYSLDTNVLGNVSGNRTINLNSGTFVTGTTTGATTWTFTCTVVSPNATGFILELTNGGSAVQTWPTSTKWPSGTAPELTAAGIDVLVFVTDDAGGTWRGVVSMLDSK